MTAWLLIVGGFLAVVLVLGWLISREPAAGYLNETTEEWIG